MAMATAKATRPRPATPLARVLRGPQGIRRNRVAFIRLPTRAITISPIAVTPPPARVIPEGRSTGRLAVVVGIQGEAVARPTLGHLVAAVVAATPVEAAGAAVPRAAAVGVVVLHPAVVAPACQCPRSSRWNCGLTNRCTPPGSSPSYRRPLASWRRCLPP